MVLLSVGLFSSALKIISRELTCQPGVEGLCLGERVGSRDLEYLVVSEDLAQKLRSIFWKKYFKDGQLRRKFCLFSKPAWGS